jgi:geranylgeranyl pyrophosphate synthase
MTNSLLSTENDKINLMPEMTAYSIKDLVSDYKNFIDQSLENLLVDHPLAEFSISKMQDCVSYSVSNGGKRLRAILAMISAEAVLQKKDSLEKENPAFALALAVELVHSGSLIHDDLPCMDDDDLRRGRASNHKVYGEDNALLAGDFLLVYPLLVLNNLNLEASLKLEIINNFNLAIQEMIIGQSLDLSLSQENEPDYKMTKRMEELKTGALIRLSVVEAARAAGASKEQLIALEKYSKNLGLAFQVVDDILDQTVSTEDLGKTAGKDEAQNKQTYVKKLGLEEAKNFANELINEAKKVLADKKLFTDKLFTVADYVVLRKN